MEAIGRTTPAFPSFKINSKFAANETTSRCHYSFPTYSRVIYSLHCKRNANLLKTSHALPVRFRRGSKVVTDAVISGLETAEMSGDEAKISEVEGSGGLEASRDREIMTIVSSDSLQYKEGFVGATSKKTAAAAAAPLCFNVPTVASYLTRILSSKVYEMVLKSPLQYAPKLSEKTGVAIWLKREDLQPVSCLLPF